MGFAACAHRAPERSLHVQHTHTWGSLARCGMQYVAQLGLLDSAPCTGKEAVYAQETASQPDPGNNYSHTMICCYRCSSGCNCIVLQYNRAVPNTQAHQETVAASVKYKGRKLDIETEQQDMPLDDLDNYNVCLCQI